MGQGKRTRRERLRAEISAALTERQLELRIVQDDPDLIIEGTFGLSSAQGVFASYQIKIIVDERFPWVEPKVMETGGVIPRKDTMHINDSNGTCCLGVWDEWLLRTPELSFRSFLSGPVHDFFLSQWWYKNKGSWPFGQRSHRSAGLIEAYADVLGIGRDKKSIEYHLRLLSKEWPKGHWRCPCGSGLIIRRCRHRAELLELHKRVPPGMARRMLRNLRSMISREQTRAKWHPVSLNVAA